MNIKTQGMFTRAEFDEKLKELRGTKGYSVKDEILRDVVNGIPAYYLITQDKGDAKVGYPAEVSFPSTRTELDKYIEAKTLDVVLILLRDAIKLKIRGKSRKSLGKQAKCDIALAHLASKSPVDCVKICQLDREAKEARLLAYYRENFMSVEDQDEAEVASDDEV